MFWVVVGPCGGDVFFRACEGLLWWVGMCRMGEKDLIRRENVLDGAESAAICLGRSRVRGSMLVCGCRRVFCQP